MGRRPTKQARGLTATSRSLTLQPAEYGETFARWIAERTDGPAPLFEKVEPGDEQPLGSSTVASLGAHLAAPEISARVPEVVKIRLDDLEEQARGKTLEGLASRQILSQPFP